MQRTTFLRAFAGLAVFTTCAAGAWPAGNPEPEWVRAEAPLLVDHVQLTSRDEFVRAGESYFSPCGTWIIFQAVPVPVAGGDEEPFYGMYIAPVKFDDGGTRIVGLGRSQRISPPGSANTCGWFDPSQPGLVLYASTLARPADEQRAGFQVGTRRYMWMFPEEMEIVEQAVPELMNLRTDTPGQTPTIAGALAHLRGRAAEARAALEKASALGMPTPPAQGARVELGLIETEIARLEELLPIEGRPRVVFSRPNYDAECSYSPCGRFILYANVVDSAPGAKTDADIYIFDTVTREHHAIVKAPGYDGGPFFSPCGKRICYRSDRKGDDKLQLFVAELGFVDAVPVRTDFEYQITSNDAVNWAPYWHPSGTSIVYGTSIVGHHNYEVFAVEIDEAALARARAEAAREGRTSAMVEGLRERRITHAPGADVLPVFTPDGEWMMWTCQRGPKAPGEERASSQVWAARVVGPFFEPAEGP